jgi:hypothetical protein
VSHAFERALEARDDTQPYAYQAGQEQARSRVQNAIAARGSDVIADDVFPSVLTMPPEAWMQNGELVDQFFRGQESVFQLL